MAFAFFAGLTKLNYLILQQFPVLIGDNNIPRFKLKAFHITIKVLFITDALK